MGSCAVATCKNYYRKQPLNVEIKFHRFPKDKSIQKQWVIKCSRKDDINVMYATICSSHFTDEDYERNLMAELLDLQRPRYMPWLVLVSSMGYLSFLHIKIQFYDHNGYSLEITGPLMVLTQKLTSLAFAIMDGIEEKKEHELSSLQKQRVVRKVPSILEFWSYVFQFQSMLAGPLVFYDDFHVFIQMEEEVPNPGLEVFTKLIKSVFFATIFLGIGPKVDTQHVRSEEFLENTSSIYKMGYIVVATTIERCKYYHAWILADAVCNMSGLGYDSAKETWDKVSNVHPFRLELSLNLKEILDNWNIGTMKLLR